MLEGRFDIGHWETFAMDVFVWGIAQNWRPKRHTLVWILVSRLSSSETGKLVGSKEKQKARWLSWATQAGEAYTITLSPLCFSVCSAIFVDETENVCLIPVGS